MTTTLRASRRLFTASTLSTTPSRARVRAPALRASLLAASSVVALSFVTAFGSTGAHATDGIWNGTNSNQWNDGTNWSSTPTTPDGTATFTTNNPTQIAISGAAATSISTIQFNPGASPYTFTVGNELDFQTNLAVTALGIVNNSTSTQTFINNSTMVFHGATSAGNANVNITNNNLILFAADSTGGNATIINTAGHTIDFSQSTGVNNDGKLSAGSLAGDGIFRPWRQSTDGRQ